jgi:SP family myo-inositol transporter-like MFS transporter 13
MVAGGMLPTFDDDDQSSYECPSPTLGGNLQKRKLSQAGGAGQQGAPSIIYLMSLLSAMGGFLFGYDTGIVSGAMVFVRKIFNLNSLWQELVVSITILGAWVLSLMAGSLSERYGRKTIILYASVIFTIGSVIMGAAWSKWILLFGRLTVGVAIGLASTVVPMYIAELAPSNIRGSLVTMNNCFITIGQLSAAITAGAFSYDHENGWRWMLAIAAIPAIIQFVGFMFMPESPRWLIRQQREQEALAALKRIRGEGACVVREFDKIRQNQLELVIQEDRRKEQKRNIIVAIFRKTATRRALTVGCLLMAAQQLAGINTVMYYTATIIEMSGVQSQSAAVWLAVPTAAVYVIFSLCGYLLADRVGRRSLTLGSLLGVILSLMLLGTGFHLTSMSGAEVTALNMSTLEACYSKRDCASCISDPRCGFCYDAKSLSIATCLQRHPEEPTKSLGGNCAGDLGSTNFVFANHICPSMSQGVGFNTWLVLFGLVMYLASFAPGMAPMPWTINSEIYPAWARSFCYSIATSVNWLFNLLISLTFISLTELITTHGAFYMYAIISAICWLLLFWKLPETRGRSLEDISSLFAKTKQPDDQDMMDDETSANQSTVGGGMLEGHQRPAAGMLFNQLAAATGRGHTNVVSCHDNLAFAGDNMSPFQMGPKVMSQTAASGDAALVERSKSFKLDSPLARLTSTLSQPDLPHHHHHHHHQHHHHQRSHLIGGAGHNCQATQQCPPPPTSVNLSSSMSSAPAATTASVTSQQQHHHSLTQEAGQQQHNTNQRKYSDQLQQPQQPQHNIHGQHNTKHLGSHQQ